MAGNVPADGPEDGGIETAPPRWIDWATRVRAIAQNGRVYTDSHFDRERYDELSRIAAEIMSAQSGIDYARAHSLFEAETGYATPKIDVRAVVFREDRLLFVKECSDGRWSLPGGWADIGISPSENVVKEVQEETGFESEAVKLLAVCDGRFWGHRPVYPYPLYKLFFRCVITGGEARASEETSEVAFFGEDELPELSTGRVTAQQLARLFQHRLNPDWPTDFD